MKNRFKLILLGLIALSIFACETEDEAPIVNVNEELLIVDRFSFLANAKIGLSITEQIITSDNDPSLFDNSRGFSNYAAPGADRLKITARLASLDLDDDQTDNFIELTRVEDGNIVFLDKTQLV